MVILSPGVKKMVIVKERGLKTMNVEQLKTIIHESVERFRRNMSRSSSSSSTAAASPPFLQLPLSQPGSASVQSSLALSFPYELPAARQQTPKRSESSDGKMLTQTSLDMFLKADRSSQHFEDPSV